MAKTLKEWLSTDVAKAEKIGVGKLSNEYFFTASGIGIFNDSKLTSSDIVIIMIYNYLIILNQFY